MKTLIGITLLSLSLIVPQSVRADDIDDGIKIANAIADLIKNLTNENNNNNNNNNNGGNNNNNNNNNQNNNNMNRPPMIGINCKTYGNNTGIEILSVRNGSVAQQIGLEPGMIIINVNGNPVGSPGEFTRELENAARWARQNRIDEEVVLEVVNQSQTEINTTRFFVSENNSTYSATPRNRHDRGGTNANRRDGGFDNLRRGGSLQ